MNTNELTRLLIDVSEGNKNAVDELFPIVYRELKTIANNKLRFEREGHTINATSLVHEAYLKLIDQNRVEWKNRSHFFGVASIAMRRILINYAKHKLADKRGGGVFSITLNEDFLRSSKSAIDLIMFDNILSELEKNSERQAKIIELYFFVGLNHEEIADVLNVSVPTVRRDFRFAKAWLNKEFKDGDNYER